MPALKLDEPRLTFEETPSTSSGEAVTAAEFASFNSSRLGLGKLSLENQPVQALAAVFNLEGFTQFCNQPDAQLVIPEFLNAYIEWHFKEIASHMKERDGDGVVHLWCRLPFFTKFLGDGMLFLWNTAGLGKTELSILAMSAQDLLQGYRDKFLPNIRKRVVNPPPRLRCGIARGQIIPIGNGEDFTGPCINIASRLQKLGGLSFAVSRRGMNFENTDSDFWKDFETKKVSLHNIADSELVYVRKKELASLSPADKALFQEP